VNASGSEIDLIYKTYWKPAKPPFNLLPGENLCIHTKAGPEKEGMTATNKYKTNVDIINNHSILNSF